MQQSPFVPTTTIPASYSTTSKAGKISKNKSGPVTIPDIETPEDLFGDSKEDDTPAIVLPKKRIPKYYLTNGDLLPAVLESKKVGKMTDKLARMLMLLTDRYSRKANFNGYSFREDMVSAALINLCQNALKFDPEKSSNPFAFYTTAIKNSFLQFMSEEKKQRYIRDSLLLDAGQDASYGFMESNKNSDDINYFAGGSNEASALESNPYKKKIDEAKAKKSKRQEEKEKKDKLAKALLSF
jgi:DNA-directed RNA polymerase specialized sigma24 family protein